MAPEAEVWVPGPDSLLTLHHVNQDPVAEQVAHVVRPQRLGQPRPVHRAVAVQLRTALLPVIQQFLMQILFNLIWVVGLQEQRGSWSSGLGITCRFLVNFRIF